MAWFDGGVRAQYEPHFTAVVNASVRSMRRNVFGTLMLFVRLSLPIAGCVVRAAPCCRRRHRTLTRLTVSLPRRRSSAQSCCCLKPRRRMLLAVTTASFSPNSGWSVTPPHASCAFDCERTCVCSCECLR